LHFIDEDIWKKAKLELMEDVHVEEMRVKTRKSYVHGSLSDGVGKSEKKKNQRERSLGALVRIEVIGKKRGIGVA
jgi:hypothetical protein